jgi:hypothetical protein
VEAPIARIETAKAMLARTDEPVLAVRLTAGAGVWNAPRRAVVAIAGSPAASI